MQQQLVEAIHTLYHHADPQVKRQTSAQLENWQQSESAWSLSDSILHDPSSSMEAQYFCAQTLRTKVQRDFEELPASAAEALRASLLNLLIRFATGATAVRTQLCLAIAAMAAHIPSRQWGEGGIVVWLAESLSKQAQDVALPCMLELLTVIPEEVGSYRPAVRPERRRSMQQEIVASAPHALQVLASCLNHKGAPSVAGPVLHAFAAWLKLSAGAGLDGADLAGHPLTKAAMEGLTSVDTFEDASDAVCELVMCTSVRGEPEQQMMPLVQLLVPAVMSLRPRFQAAAQQAQSQGGSEDDVEAVKGMARLFAELGESYVGLLAQASPDATQPVEALLDVAAYPDQAISAISFNFWHHLMRRLTLPEHSAHVRRDVEIITSHSQDPAANTRSVEMQRRLDVFTPAFQRLVTVVAHNVQYPPDHHEWHQDEVQDFKQARYAIAEALEDAAEVLGWQRTLGLLLAPLQQLATAFDWRVAEASLYCVRCIHKTALPAAEPLLLSLFGSLPSMPTNAGAGSLPYTVANLIGTYSDWLARTLKRGTQPSQGHGQSQGQLLVPQLLQLLMQFLEHTEASGAAASAIRNICHSCGRYLASSYLEGLMQLYQKVQGQGAAAPIGTQKLAERDVLAITEAVTSLVASLQGDSQASATQALLEPILGPLQGLLQQPHQNGAGPGQQVPGAGQQDNLEYIGALVDRLSTVFKRTTNASLAATNLAHCWPLLVTVLTQYSSNDRIAEKTGRAIKQALQSSKTASAAMLPQVVETVAQQFQQSRQPCMLYIASELLKAYGADQQFQAPLGQLFSTLVVQALQGLQQLSGYDNNPDMADDTFLLISRGVRYSPGVVYNPHMLPIIVDAAMIGVLVQHRDACCSILSVLRRLHNINDPDSEVRVSHQQEQQLRAVMLQKDPLLVRILLGGALGALPKSRVDDIAAVFYDMLYVYRGEAYPWIVAALAAIPNQAATDADKHSFLKSAQDLASGIDNRWDIETALDDLSEVCRRNRHSEEAAVRSLLPPELYQASMPQ